MTEEPIILNFTPRQDPLLTSYSQSLPRSFVPKKGLKTTNRLPK